MFNVSFKYTVDAKSVLSSLRTRIRRRFEQDLMLQIVLKLTARGNLPYVYGALTGAKKGKQTSRLMIKKVLGGAWSMHVGNESALRSGASVATLLPLAVEPMLTASMESSIAAQRGMRMPMFDILFLATREQVRVILTTGVPFTLSATLDGNARQATARNTSRSGNRKNDYGDDVDIDDKNVDNSVEGKSLSSRSVVTLEDAFAHVAPDLHSLLMSVLTERALGHFVEVQSFVSFI